MTMEKAIFTASAPIWLSPELANAGHMEHHAAPEREIQCQHWSLWAADEFSSLAWLTESHAREVAYRLGLIENDWRCGEGENRCRCAGPGECGYAYIEEKAAGL